MDLIRLNGKLRHTKGDKVFIFNERISRQRAEELIKSNKLVGRESDYLGKHYIFIDDVTIEKLDVTATQLENCTVMTIEELMAELE
jgi:hypothetical protein